MKNQHRQLFRPYFSLLLLSAFLFFAACDEEEDDSDTDSTSQTTDTTGIVQGVVTDASLRSAMGAAKRSVFWRGTVILDGPVYVQDGETLTIQAASVIKGRAKPEGQTASSLIIARGGKLIAEGTKESPIIFTYEEDPLDGSTPPSTRGRWGGVIILGKASLNSTPATTSIEGIPTTEERGKYGGTEDSDNSGSLRYLSIRHGGAVIGANNEINGLTLGGVGSGTTIEYIEVIGNKDDGIELFGGRVNLRYLISAYNADDAVDYDEGYRGFCQFVILHQDPGAEAADRGFECDGGTTPEDAEPYATPIFVNVTLRGNRTKRVATFRDNAGGFFYNSLFTGSAKGIDIEKTSGTANSYLHFQNARLVFKSNAFHISGADNLNQLYKINVPAAGNGEDSTEDLSDSEQRGLENAKNKPNVGISFKKGSSQPSVTTDFPDPYVLPDSELSNYPSHGYQNANYIGAVDPSGTPWYEGWSFYHQILQQSN